MPFTVLVLYITRRNRVKPHSTPAQEMGTEVVPSQCTVTRRAIKLRMPWLLDDRHFVDESGVPKQIPDMMYASPPFNVSADYDPYQVRSFQLKKTGQCLQVARKLTMLPLIGVFEIPAFGQVWHVQWGDFGLYPGAFLLYPHQAERYVCGDLDSFRSAACMFYATAHEDRPDCSRLVVPLFVISRTSLADSCVAERVVEVSNRGETVVDRGWTNHVLPEHCW